MKTPLQQLEAKILASNPELKQLGVGCEIRTQKYTCEVLAKFNNSITCIDVDNKWIRRFEIDKHYLEIIGKPPTLVDVLKYYLSIKDDGFLFVSENSNIFLGIHKESRVEWNLNSIYLRDQDEVLINFLNNLEK